MVEWLEWWNERKEFMFRDYTSIDAPSSNLREVVHGRWQNVVEVKLSLLATTYADVTDSLPLSEQLIQVQKGVYDGGGSIRATTEKRNVGDEINRTTLLGQEIIDHEVKFLRSRDVGRLAEKTSTEKMFVNNTKTVRKVKYSMKVNKMEEITQIDHRYDVENSEKSRTSYNCHISLQPSCSYSDYAPHGGHFLLCKHIVSFIFWTKCNRLRCI